MTYTINTSACNEAENGTEEERTFYIVTGTQNGQATIIGQRTAKRPPKRSRQNWKPWKMSEALYHALGLCGEHWHPNPINVSPLPSFWAAYRTSRKRA